MRSDLQCGIEEKYVGTYELDVLKIQEVFLPK